MVGFHVGGCFAGLLIAEKRYEIGCYPRSSSATARMPGPDAVAKMCVLDYDGNRIRLHSGIAFTFERIPQALS
jgi:hypothetical protein